MKWSKQGENNLESRRKGERKPRIRRRDRTGWQVKGIRKKVKRVMGNRVLGEVIKSLQALEVMTRDSLL